MDLILYYSVQKKEQELQYKRLTSIRKMNEFRNVVKTRYKWEEKGHHSCL